MRNLVIIAGVAALSASAAAAQSLSEAWRLGGLTMPESAYWDQGSDQIIVSQIGGFGPDTGADGKLSLVSPEGEMIAEDWVTGLIDPKGMASHEGLLYVADMDGLHVIDIATGVPGEVIAMPGAMLLNDVTVGDDGAIYVTDMMAGGIFRLQDGSVDQLVEAGGLPLPNGVLAEDGRLVVGSFGDEMDMETFAVANPGGLLSVDPATGEVTPVAGTEASGSVDGIASLGDWLVYNDNPSGKIMGVRDGAMTALGETAPGSADLGATDELLIVPNLNSGEVVAYRVE